MLRIILPFILLLSLADCGFQSVYQDEKQAAAPYVEKLAQIRIQKKRIKVDQDLKNNLYDLLNPDYIQAEPKYLLVLNTEVNVMPTFITVIGAAGRYKIVFNITYQLKDLETAKTIASGTTVVNDNYDITANRFGTFVVDEYVKSNLTKVAAQNIRNALINDFIELDKKEKGEKSDQKINQNDEKENDKKTTKSN
jgi:hypothetical protein